MRSKKNVPNPCRYRGYPIVQGSGMLVNGTGSVVSGPLRNVPARRAMRHIVRTLESWPYLFIAISVAGLIYIAFNATR